MKKFCTPEVVLDRIKVAKPESPIAVFRCNEEGKLDAVFAATIQSMKEIRDGCGLVGVYHREMNLDRVMLDLQQNAGVGGGRPGHDAVTVKTR